jgi:hypothetical protein
MKMPLLILCACALLAVAPAAQSRNAFGIDMHAAMPINVPLSVPIAFFPLGEWKQSLVGDLARHGVEEIYFNTRTEAVTTRSPKEDAVTSGFITATHG